MKKINLGKKSVIIKNPLRLSIQEKGDIDFINKSIDDIEKVSKITETFIGADKKEYDKIPKKTKTDLLDYKAKFEKIKLDLNVKDVKDVKKTKKNIKQKIN